MDLEYQKQNGGFVPYYLGVAESGDIAVVGSATTNIILYDGATGKEKYTLPSHQILTNSDGMIAIKDNTIVTLGQDQENLLNYGVLTGKQTGVTQVEALDSRTRFSGGR